MTGWHQFREDWLNKWAMCIRAKKKTNKTSHKRENRPNVKKKKNVNDEKQKTARKSNSANKRPDDWFAERRANKRTNERRNEPTCKQTNEWRNERTSARTTERTSERTKERIWRGGGGGGGRRRTVKKAYKWIEKASVQVANKLNEPLTLLTTSQPSEWVTHETTEVRKLLKTEKNVVGWVEIQTNQIEK